MLIGSKSFKGIVKQVFTTLSKQCNNLGFKQMFSHFNLILTYIACDDEHVCDANGHALGY
jgi:hypothetical protein